MFPSMSASIAYTSATSSNNYHSTGCGSVLRQATLSVENVGRFKGANKKLITWSFVDTSGSNDGKENQEPHTVTLQWNKRNGKIVITMNGTQVCSYNHGGNDIISHKWTTQDGTKMVIVAARVTPNGVSDNFQKYGLIVNGQEVPVMKSAEAGYDGQAVEASYSSKTTSILQMLYPNGYMIDSKTEELLLGEEMGMETERMVMV